MKPQIGNTLVGHDREEKFEVVDVRHGIIGLIYRVRDKDGDEFEVQYHDISTTHTGDLCITGELFPVSPFVTSKSIVYRIYCVEGGSLYLHPNGTVTEEYTGGQTVDLEVTVSQYEKYQEKVAGQSFDNFLAARGWIAQPPTKALYSFDGEKPKVHDQEVISASIYVKDGKIAAIANIRRISGDAWDMWMFGDGAAECAEVVAMYGE